MLGVRRDPFRRTSQQVAAAPSPVIRRVGASVDIGKACRRPAQDYVTEDQADVQDLLTQGAGLLEAPARRDHSERKAGQPPLTGERACEVEILQQGERAEAPESLEGAPVGELDLVSVHEGPVRRVSKGRR
jgi:hypothetical protein